MAVKGSRVLLISNSTLHGGGYLDHAEAEIRDFLGDARRVLFVPFALYDRELGAVVYVNAEDVSAKYRNLRAVLGAEANPKIEYADLRFADRVIVKAVETNHVQN